MHRYLNVKGGFLAVSVERSQGQIQAVLTHHGVDGTVYNQDIVKAVDRGPVLRQGHTLPPEKKKAMLDFGRQNPYHKDAVEPNTSLSK